jgi:hypothetical protein
MATANKFITTRIIVKWNDDKKNKAIDISLNVKQAIVEDDDRLIDKAVVLLDSPHMVADSIPREGLAMTVGMGWVTEYAILFKGIITKIITEAQGGVPQLKVVALDPSYQMMLSSDKRPNPQQNRHEGKVSEIIQRIVTAYHIPVDQIKVDPDITYNKDHPKFQGPIKDWEFIQQLAADYNARAYVEYNTKGSQEDAYFYFQPESALLQGNSIGTLQYCQGSSQLLDFKLKRIASTADAQRRTIVIDPTTGEPKITPKPPDAPPDAPKPPDPGALKDLARNSATAANNLEQAASSVAKADVQDQRPKTTVPGQPSDITIPERIGKQDPTQVKGMQLTGTAIGSVHLRAKGKMTVKGIPLEGEGDWYVRKVIHTYTHAMEGTKESSTYRTEFEATR